MRIVGIDPGFTGAIAFLDPGTMDLEVHDMPVVAEAKGKKSINFMALGTILSPNSWPVQIALGRYIAMIEKVHAMPNQGVSSTFRFGEGYGAIQMACAGHGYEMHYTSPAAWKKHFKLNSDGEVSRGLAIQRFPKAAQSFSRKLDHGRAEAALLALFAAETLKL